MNRDNPHFTNRQRAPYQLGHLLRDLPRTPDLTDSDTRLKLEAAESHAENYSGVLLSGLESLGRVLFIAGENEQWDVEQYDVCRIGALISELSIQLQFLDEFRISVINRITEADQKGARK